MDSGSDAALCHVTASADSTVAGLLVPLNGRHFKKLKNLRR